MTSLLKHNSDFIMLLPDPSASMCDDLLQCITAAVHLISQCTLGKHSVTESMAQNLLPVEDILAVLSNTQDPIPLRYQLPYLHLLMEVWFVVEDTEEVGAMPFSNGYKWMANQMWWDAVDAFVRIMEAFRDMEADNEDFVELQEFIFEGVLPCFTSYLTCFWDPNLANQLPVQVRRVKVRGCCPLILWEVYYG